MVAISFPLVYTKCFFCFEDNEIQQLFYHILVIVLFQIGWAIVQISHLSIIPNITNVPAQRSIESNRAISVRTQVHQLELNNGYIYLRLISNNACDSIFNKTHKDEIN